MAKRSGSLGGMAPALIGAAAAIVAALIGAGAIVWQTTRTADDRATTTAATSAAGTPSGGPTCAAARGAPLVRVEPNVLKTGDTARITGVGPVGAVKVDLVLYGEDRDTDLGAITTQGLDECGRFDYATWVVPASLKQSGNTRIRMYANFYDGGGKEIASVWQLWQLTN